LQNGGFINPPAVKRQFRDPTADWWDKQERRNFGEPLHEDNELVSIMAPYEYDFTTGKAAFAMAATFMATIGSIVGICYAFYPDKLAYPTEYEGGLVRELGGMGAPSVSLPSLCRSRCQVLTKQQARRPGDAYP